MERCDDLKVSVVTPNFNGERFLEETIKSVLSQKDQGVDVEYIIVDGGSTDRSLSIVEQYRHGVSHLLCGQDEGPADAINKGLALAGGDILAWLNADDFYLPGALKRVVETMSRHSDKALCFGHCPIVDEEGREIRKGITRFKESFYPLSSRFAIQSINYISQPAAFFRRSAFIDAGPLRTDLLAAWDYELFLRIWKEGGAVRADAGFGSLQSMLHLGARWGIVGIYSLMALSRRRT
jgi:glycosyltransferase involved in cell wall biosynthesis